MPGKYMPRFRLVHFMQALMYRWFCSVVFIADCIGNICVIILYFGSTVLQFLSRSSHAAS